MPIIGTTSERYLPRIDIGKMVADYFSTVYPVVLNPKERLSASDAEVDSFLCEV